jgi:rare lipoprotein A
MTWRLASTLWLLGISALLPAAQQSATKATGGPSTVKASYYSNRFNGRVTAGKERFSNTALTAAHRELPLGSRVKLTNPANNRSVVVRINDRGPFVTGRDISVTRRAARALGFTRAGVAEVSMEVLGAGR